MMIVNLIGLATAIVAVLMVRRSNKKFNRKIDYQILQLMMLEERIKNGSK